MEIQKFNVVDAEGLNISYEVYSDRAFVHCTVDKLTPSILRKCYTSLAEVLNTCKERGIKGVYTVTPNPRFAYLMGGTPCAKMRIDGKECEVFKWELK